MKYLALVLFSIAIITVKARHRKEWQKVNVKKAGRELLLPYYKSEIPTCDQRAGFYRDPKDCHQYIRCVDEFSTGRKYSVFVGRCEPGLVFDENISSCNWPELAAPCSNSPEKLEAPPSKFKPQQETEVNVISQEHNKWNKPYPEPQKVDQSEVSDQTFDTGEQLSDQQNIIQQTQPQDQQQISDETSDDFQSAIQTPIQQQPQLSEDIETHKDEDITSVSEQSGYESQISNSPQQQTQKVWSDIPKQHNIHQEAYESQMQEKDENHEFHADTHQEQVSEDTSKLSQKQVTSGNFQEIIEDDVGQIQMSENEHKNSQQQEWWVSDNDDSYHSEPIQVNQQNSIVRVPTTLEEPITCNSEGFFRHPTNCSRFVRCVREQGAYSIHFFECGKQLVFDEKESYCTRSTDDCNPRRSKRQVGNSPLECSSEGFFRHPSDCRAFYRCVIGTTGNYETHLFSCPETLIFDEEYTTCNWPEKTSPCENRRRLGNPPKRINPTRSAYKPIQKTSTKNYWTTTKPKNDFEDKRILTPVRGISRNQSTQKPKAPVRGEQTCTSPGFFRHDKDCTKFYKCIKRKNNFVKYEISCPNNLAFDAGTSRCVPQKYVSSCNKSKRPLPPRQDDDENSPVSEASSTTPRSVELTDAPEDGIKCEEEGYFRNPNDCNRFYRCVDFSGEKKEFVRYDFKCPEGLVFDEKNSICTWPDQSAPCEGGSGTKKDNGDSKSTQKESDNESTSTTSTESPTTTRKTTTRRTTTKTTPKPTRTTTKSTTTDESTKESSNTDDAESKPGEGESSEGCEKEGFYRNPEDCNKFYRCVDFNGDGKDFVRYDFSCPEGLVFDEGNSVCTWPDESAPCDSSSGGGKDGNNKDGEGTSGTKIEKESTTESSMSTPKGSTTDRGTTTTRKNKPRPSSTTKSPERSTATERTERPQESSSTTSIPPRGDDEIGSQGDCKEAGFFRDPKDCNKFYRCVDYNGDGTEFVKYEFSCPEGLVFDEQNSVCNWPDESAPCDSSSGGKDDKKKPDEETGSNKEEKDSTTESTVTTSKDSTTDRSTTTSRTSRPRPSPTTKPPERSTSSRTESPGEISSTESSTPSRSDDETSDQGECKEPGFFRDPKDCNKFYRCVDYNGDGSEFVKYEFSCPEGLVFDEENSVCNWPEQSAPCDGSSSKDSSTKSDKTTSQSSSTTPSSITSSTIKESSDTTESSSSTVTSSTTKSSTEQKIAEDQTTAISTRPTSTSSSDESENQSTTESSTTKHDESSRDGECTKAGFFRNPKDCNKFYRCVDFNGDGQEFVKYDFTCPEGLNFDEINNVCNWPDQSPKCEANGNGGEENVGEDEISKQSSTTSQGESTTTSFTTESSTPTSTTARSEQTTSQSTQSTTNSEQTTSTSGNKEECREEGFFRCQDDCSKFYRCVADKNSGEFKRYDFNCPEGLIFDDSSKKCDWPSSELTCESSSTTSSETTGASTTVTQSSTTRRTSGTRTTPSATTLSTTTTAPSTTTTAPSTTTTASSTTQTGECTEEGFFRHPDDCSKYYRCMDEGDGRLTREDFSCAEDEVFDEEMRFCNRKDLAPPCDQTSTKSQSTTENSSTSSRESTTESLSSSTSKESTTESSSATSSGTATTSSSSAKCEEAGFMRDSNDCSKFYRCVEENENGPLVKHNFTCPEGLIFDVKNERCDSPSSELTCETESTTSSSTSSTSTASDTSTTKSQNPETSSGECTEEGFFRDPEDCSKYYRCMDEGDGNLIREDFSCAEDEVFDEEMRYCNRKDLAPPCNESISTTSTESSTTSPLSTTQRSSTVTEESTQTTSSNTGSQGDGECNEEGFHRDPNDCRKFYRCVDFRGDGKSFTKYDFECPDDLVFDDTNNVCNWPSAVRSCESSESSNRSTTESTSSTSKSDGTASTTQDDGSTSTTGSDRTTTITKSDEKSTTTEEKTSTTVSSTSKEEGTSTTQEQPGTSTTSKETTDATSSTSSQTSKEIECKEEGFFRNPDDCNKFYRCVDFAGTGESFVRYDFECPEGLVFDEVNNVCNWPEMSPACDSSQNKGSTSTTTESASSKGTGDRSTGEDSTGTTSTSNTRQSTTSGTTSDFTSTSVTTQASTSQTESSGDFKCEEEGFFRHPKDCKKYYECKRDPDSGELVKIDCECQDGHIFDTEGWYCNAEELSPPCDDGSFKCAEEGFFRDPEDCTKYYHCNKTSPDSDQFSKKRFECPDGTVFDEEGRYCNEPEFAAPCNNTTTEDDGTSSTTSSGMETTSSSSTGSTSSESKSTTSSEKTSECTKEGFFRNPDDCTQYYQCTRNEETGDLDKHDFTCPDGRIFDEGPSYCNDPRLSEEPCDKTSTQDQTGSQTPTTKAATESSSTKTSTSEFSTAAQTDLTESTTQTSADSTSTQSSTTGSDNKGSGKSGGEGDCTQAGFFRHPQDCNKFYRCVDFSGSGESFVRYDFDCPEGLHFDEINSVCNWPTMYPRCESRR